MPKLVELELDDAGNPTGQYTITAASHQAWTPSDVSIRPPLSMWERAKNLGRDAQAGLSALIGPLAGQDPSQDVDYAPVTRE